MTNLEKYKDIFEKRLSQEPLCFIALKLKKGIEENTTAICYNRNCVTCRKESLEWLAQEYTESTDKKEFTQDELIILKNIDKKWKWIARDENNILIIFSKKPFKASDYWTSNDAFQKISIFNCFKQIQWKDIEPVFIDDYVNRKGE